MIHKLNKSCNMAFTGLPDEPGLQMLFLYHEKSIQVL